MDKNFDGTHWSDASVIIEVNPNDLSSALCDAYDIKDRIRSYGIKDKPKDADGSETTIGDCINDIIYFLEELEKEEKDDNQK